MNQTVQIDPATRDALQQMVRLARGGQLDQARQVGKAALDQVADKSPVHALLGRIACDLGDFDDGASHFEAALDAHPGDPASRFDLVSALLHAGRLEQALAAADRDHAFADRTLQLARLRGYVAQRLDRHSDAVEAYHHVVERAPDDAGTWNNLGNALAAMDQLDAAIDALRQATKLDPGSAPTRMNLATWLSAVGKVDEAAEVLRRMAQDFPDDEKPPLELGRMAAWIGQDQVALEAYEEAAKRQPKDPQIQVELGHQRRGDWDISGAESAFRSAIALDPAFASAYVALATLFEHDNRPSELPALVDQAKANNIDPAALAMLQAYAHRRAKEWQQGLASAERAEGHDPVRRFQLIGEFKDRLDDPAGAFAAFEQMNRLVAENPRQPLQQAERYRSFVDGNIERMTGEWLGAWTPAVPIQSDERPAPAFLTGFPRSGTTLLDTMLMGHPDVQVMEERPALTDIERRVGGIEALPALDAGAIRAARDDYWQEAAKHVELRPGTLLVDKGPLYVNKTAIIHRLFPDARFILALRHPMDVVLSCFITNFRPNPAMANFLELRRAAELYDRSMTAFQEARRLLDLPVYTVVYERMVADRDNELRPLFEWLGLDWREEAVDHQATAAKRGVITTASYAQVHEPLYTRSAGRWTRYAEQLEPVRDLIAPWVEKFGYSLDDPSEVPEREGA